MFTTGARFDHSLCTEHFCEFGCSGRSNHVSSHCSSSCVSLWLAFFLGFSYNETTCLSVLAQPPFSGHSTGTYCLVIKDTLVRQSSNQNQLGLATVLVEIAATETVWPGKVDCFRLVAFLYVFSLPLKLHLSVTYLYRLDSRLFWLTFYFHHRA